MMKNKKKFKDIGIFFVSLRHEMTAKQTALLCG